MASKALEVIMMLLLFLLTLMVNVYGIPHENALNLPQLLLPYAADGTAPTNYQLRAQRGCFKWTSTKPNIATVVPINELCNGEYEEISDESACSQSALVTVKTKIPSEDTTVVLAEEEGSGTTLRCDVFVDIIDHVSIATTARELLIGESPEVFDIYAYDEEGNMFSALGSTTFEWRIKPLPHVEQADQRSVLKMLWFHDSIYETSREINSLETKQLRGSSVLIEGISTGDAIVSAKVSHPDYKDVESKVKVTVLDNVLLLPPNEYILVQQTVKYSAMQLRRGKQNVITLPSEQYSLKVVDTHIGKLNETDITVKGLNVGVTKVQLIDKNTANLSSARLPTASLHVVDPAKIGFAINPGKMWILEVGREYYLHVRLLDNDKNRIKIDENVVLDSILSDEYFDIHLKSTNGSYFYVRPKKVGATLLTSTLKGVMVDGELKAISQLITGEQSIEIYEPVAVTPESVLFPWEPTLNGLQNYQYQLAASGGSGNYVWSHLDSTVAMVNKKGIVSAGSAVGEAVIKVFDAKNSNHFAQAKVTVLPPTEITFIDGKVEASIGSTLKLALAVSASIDQEGKEKAYFKDCRKMNLQYTFTDATAFKLVHTEAEILADGCTSIVVEGVNPGHTTLTATYTYADVTLQATVVIAAYRQVTVIDPFEFSTVALGSKKRIVAEAGPLPWVLDSSQYHHVMSAEKEDSVSISPVVTSDDVGVVGRLEHVFDVTCVSLGEQLLTVRVFNKPTLKNKFPAESSITTKFICAPPGTMKLVPSILLTEIDGKRRTLESCKDEQSRIPVLNDRDVKLNLLVYDLNGNLFDDASSLNIEWTTDDAIAAQFPTATTQSAGIVAGAGKKRNSGILLFNVLQVHAKQLAVTVSATITSYKSTPNETIQPPVSVHLPMVTVPAPIISPNSLNMFVHQSNQLTLNVAGGTQQFVLKGSGNTDLKYTPPAIQVTPTSEGVETVLLYDACLDADKPAEAQLHLSDLYAVKLQTPDKVEIAKTIEARCIATDKAGNELVLSTEATKIINFQLKMSAPIVEISSEEMVSDLSRKSHVLSGKSVGMASLTCHVTQLTGTEISSKAADVQVFSPLELDPKYVLLIVGSLYQIHSRGGPRPHSTTVFSSVNQTVARVNKLGLVTANVIGKTMVTGEAKGDIVYSEDHTVVDVVQLKGFKISLKSRNLITNTEVGILSVGLTDEGPFTFATSPPYLKFHWSTSNNKVAVIESFHQKAGVGISSDEDFRAVIRVLGAGSVTIKLNVQVMSNDHQQVHEFAKLDDEIEIQVFDKLQLLYPTSGNLLLPNHGTAKLLSNKDQVVSVSYELLPSGCPALVKDSIVSVSASGHVVASSASGTANVLVTAHEEFGFNQTLLVQIEVKPVASITLVSNSHFVITGNQEHQHPSFPIGSTIQFGVALHDAVARKFDVSSIPLQHTTTRSDIVQVIANSDEMSFSIRAENIGETILKVWDKENPSIADYVRVAITEGVIPSKATITLGETICFTASVPSENGLWSPLGNLVSLKTQSSGVAVAVSTGTSRLNYNDNNYATDTEITVVAPTKNPSLVTDNDDSSPPTISNNEKTHVYHVTLDTTLGACAEATLTSTTDAIPLSCSARWSDSSTKDIPVESVFRVVAAYVGGEPQCSVTSLPLSIGQEKLLTDGERTLELSARLTDANSRNEYSSEAVGVRFIPKFYVDADSVMFNAQETLKMVKVLGVLSDVESITISCDSSAIFISRNADNIEISTHSGHTSDIHTSITFTSVLSKHSAQLPVTIIGTPVVALETPQCPVTPPREEAAASLWSAVVGESSSWVIFYTVVLATIILILLVYHVAVKKRQVKPILVGPPPYSPYMSPGGRPATPATQYFTQHHHTPPYKSPGSPGSRVKPNTLFSVSQ